MRISDWSSDVCSSDLDLLSFLDAGPAALSKSGRNPHIKPTRAISGPAISRRSVRVAAPPNDRNWPRGTILTVGHSTLPIERFTALLAAYAIERLVDVRTVPRSRHNPQFNADALAASLADAPLLYAALPAPGDRKSTRLNSSH